MKMFGYHGNQFQILRFGIFQQDLDSLFWLRIQIITALEMIHHNDCQSKECVIIFFCFCVVSQPTERIGEGMDYWYKYYG